MTQAQLSEALGYKSQSITSMWENGDRQPPVKIIPKLAETLNCTIDDLFKDE